MFDSWMMPRGDLYHPPAGTLADQRDWMEERVLARLENPSPFGENRLVVLCFTTLEFETRLIFLACFSLNLLSSTKCIQQQPKGDNFTLKCATNLNQILKKCALCVSSKRPVGVSLSSYARYHFTIEEENSSTEKRNSTMDHRNTTKR